MQALKITTNNSKWSDTEIIQRVIAGERELYELLLRRNNQKLFRVIRSYIKDSNEVEDVMQNAYLKAYEKLYQFKHTSSFSTWLIRIGINEALSKVRERRNINSIESLSHSIGKNHVIQMQRNQLSPEELVIQQETKHIIEKAIDILDSKHKVVFIMKEVEGMSIKEISGCLDLSTSNVKVRLHRAKAILKEKLIELHLKKDLFNFGADKCDRLVNLVMEKI